MQLSTSSILHTPQSRWHTRHNGKEGWRQDARNTPRMAAAYTPAAGLAGKQYTLHMSLDVDDVHYEEKKDFMKKKLGLKEPITFLLSPHVPPTETMMGFLRLRELKGMDAFLLKPVFKDDLWDIKSEPGSQDNERAVCATMEQVAREAISRHLSTTEDHRALLQGGTLQPGSPEEAAVKARLGELECLEYIAAWFKQRAARLPQLPYYEKRRLRRLGIIEYDWLKLRHLRKIQGQPDLFLRDASHIFPHGSAGYLFNKYVDTCTTCVYAQRMAEYWPLALAATYIMVGNTAFWRDWQFVLIVPFWLYFLFTWYKSRSALVVLSYMSKRRAASMSARNANDAVQASSESVSVGFLDDSMSLPVFRYLFSCC